MKKIMFICSAGMSTSMLVQKVEAEAKAKGYDYEIWASSEAEAKKRYEGVDVILLGPQVRFLLSKVKGAVAGQDTKVDVIDTVDYGRMNGEGVLNQINKLLGIN